MTRVHDMGGRYGDGRVVPDASAAVFEEEWHARALAVTLAAGALGQWNIDTSRHARERLSPKDYARFTYYEKWMAGLADLLVEKGVLSIADLSGRSEDTSHPLAESALPASAVARMIATGGPADRPADSPPMFQPGQAVRTRKPAANAFIDGGHTRLPAYAVGAIGRIVTWHGNHVLPDANAHGLGEQPQPLYAVVFAASVLWSNPEHPRDEVVLDLWQSYLEPV